MRRRRRAFTLVELLVVIGIICILIGMLMPAVQAARESARRLSCSNHIRQLGVGAMSYESIHGRYPPGAGSAAKGSWGLGWPVFLFPFTEQQTLYDHLDRTGETCTMEGFLHTGLLTYNPQNARVLTGQKIPCLLCPSSTLANKVRWADEDFVGPEGVIAACYVAVTGSSEHRTAIDRDKNPVGEFPAYGIQSLGGVMLPRKGVAHRDITDGASNTILIGEQSDYCYHRDGTPMDPRSDAFRTFALGVLGSEEKNETRWFNTTTVRYPINTRDWHLPGMAPWQHIYGANRPILSPHPGGAHVVRADGSVMFLDETLDLKTLLNLCDRDDGRAIEEPE